MIRNAPASLRVGGTAASALPRGQALGARFGKSAGALEGTQVFLIIAAGIAIALLGLAALPEAALGEPRLAALVETRRVELALVGMSILLAAIIVYLTHA